MAATNSSHEVDLKRAIERALLGFAPVLLSLAVCIHLARHGNAGIDFRLAFWPAGRAVLNGQTPYGASQAVVAEGFAFVYPAPAAWLFAVGALLPRDFASWLALALCIALALATLRVLRVRDWRVYGAMMLWEPVIGAWETANLTLLLAFGLALLWRWRDDPRRAALAGTLLIAIKPLGWPVLVFLALTRRWRALALTLLITAALNLIAWLLIGFSEVSAWLRLVRELDDALWRQGYGFRALAAALGCSDTIGKAIAVLLPVALLIGATVLARQGRERELLTVIVAIMLTASPLVWNHYFALLIVPLAIWYPRLHPIWLFPLLAWVLVPPERTGVTTAQLLLNWAIAGVCLAWPLVRSSPGRSHGRQA